MIEQIVNIHTQMKELTLGAGVEAKRYHSVIAELDEFEDSELQEIMTWLERVYHNEYKGVSDIWFAQPNYMWERYMLFGEDEFREVRLLKAAQKKLRNRWKHPYRTEKQKARMKNRKNPVKHDSMSDTNESETNS